MREGVEPARYFNSLGVAAFVLKYRLGREPGSPYKPEVHAREDGLRAMRLVRSRASEWGIDPNRIGIMGFSAGGEVASLVAFGPADGRGRSRPTRSTASTPARTSSSRSTPAREAIPEKVSKDAAPGVPAGRQRRPRRVPRGRRLFQKYREARAPVEAHVFARGGHGFKMGRALEAGNTQALAATPGRLDGGQRAPHARQEAGAARGEVLTDRTHCADDHNRPRAGSERKTGARRHGRGLCAEPGARA